MGFECTGPKKSLWKDISHNVVIYDQKVFP